MPARQRNQQAAAGGRDYPPGLERALKLAHRHLSRKRTARYILLTCSIPLLLAAFWVALIRFSLLDLPWWPVLLAPILWLPLLTFWLSRKPITRARCACFLDAALELDERVLTCLEVGGRTWLGSRSGL